MPVTWWRGHLEGSINLTWLRCSGNHCRVPYVPAWLSVLRVVVGSGSGSGFGVVPGVYLRWEWWSKFETFDTMPLSRKLHMQLRIFCPQSPTSLSSIQRVSRMTEPTDAQYSL